MEDNSPQVFIERQLTLFVSVESQMVPGFQISRIQVEFLDCPSANVMVPPIGKEDAPDIEKQAADWGRFFHCLTALSVTLTL
ncbi:MAG: hypothetical protein JWL90_1716 [Chthoniobacteraceae bacterium]|jgi:hypothetical protein|nr:hypothetical protein [Chthoniobacteraceae bacterium]